ncbi:hypothetical protein CDES_08325 [Corynebacterium deserti GIMN1.010]|uniref:Secreted protein n=1 Tax=Corynebacterium deserti GIMN1.010 TaxID=931089 RepID=A0A0M4CYC4_9CORY|nr:hypothetical protein [Corynebacterium deserti]ALC06070.1 hypothetical protein CDES_08325 [Corynebacterium deserti GIMN1.010]
MTIVYLLLAIAITAMLLWAYFTAQRLNRLHIRTDSARQALQAALDRRAVLVGALLPKAIEPSKRAEAITLEYSKFSQRARAEREISEIILQQQSLPEPIIDAATRVELAHRFYNEAVSDTRNLRTRLLVRTFRLGGTAPLPEYFELLDTDLLA